MFTLEKWQPPPFADENKAIINKDSIPNSDTIVQVDKEPTWDEKEFLRKLVYPEEAKKADKEGQVILNIYLNLR